MRACPVVRGLNCGAVDAHSVNVSSVELFLAKQKKAHSPSARGQMYSTYVVPSSVPRMVCGLTNFQNACTKVAVLSAGPGVAASEDVLGTSAPDAAEARAHPLRRRRTAPSGRPNPSKSTRKQEPCPAAFRQANLFAFCVVRLKLLLEH